MPRASRVDASHRIREPLPRKPVICLRLIQITAFLLLSLSAVLAQGLYGPEAPRDVSYLRVMNASPGEAVTPVVGGTEWQALDFAEVSPYRQLPPGDHTVSIAGFEQALATQPESFTTLVVLEDELLTIADDPLRDISRGLLSFYNLTEESTLSLTTGDGTEVLSGVPPHSAAARTISEAEVELVVIEAGEPIGSLESQLYRRGEAHGIVVLPIGSSPQVIYVRAAAER